MRLIFVCLTVTTAAAGLAWGAAMVSPDVESDRTKAQQLLKQGNSAEAYVLFKRLALNEDNTGKELPQDLRSAVQCLQQLNRVSEFDELFEDAVQIHQRHWRFMLEAGTFLATHQIQPSGFLIGGEFERGNHRGGGKSVSSLERDRVRGLQLMQQAIALMDDDSGLPSTLADNESAIEIPAATAKEKFDAYQTFGNVLAESAYSEAWKLQDLTDLNVLPDYEEGNRYGWRGQRGGTSKGAPVGVDGQPVLHQQPASFSDATSDGQRWRWALHKARLALPDRQSEIDLQWASFLQSQFGVGTAGVEPPVLKDGKHTPEAQAWSLHTLNDNSTVTKLATGIQQLTLPAEFNHLTIVNSVIERSDSQLQKARLMLLSVRMSRHQYPQAAGVLRELIADEKERRTRENYEKQLSQIVDNWLEFNSAKVKVAGESTTLNVRFRNGAKIQFEAREINMELLLEDIKQYLQSRPETLERNRMTIETIGYRLLNEPGTKKYLGRKVAEWTTAVKSSADHFDGALTVTTPLQTVGSYMVKGKIDDGNETNIVLNIVDTAITRKRVEGGTLYFVADARTGTPIARADLEFFGWDQVRVAGTRKYTVATRRLADRTNESGLCTPNTQQLAREFQWLTIARTKDGRTAYDGFSRVWQPSEIRDTAYTSSKVYAITDRPVYRPKHDVKFRMWYRFPRFHDDTAQHANKPFEVRIRNPKGDYVLESNVKTDQWGGVDGSYTLPANASLGVYQIQLGLMKTRTRTRRVNGKSEKYTQEYFQSYGGGSFRVEEYRKPEFKVTVDAPSDPVQLGEKISATIKANYYFGAPVTEATVKYKVERSKKDARWYPTARWDWLYTNGYWWFGYDYNWYPGWNRWGCYAPVMPWWNWRPDPPEVVAEGEVAIGEDGTYELQIDTAAALKQHSDSDHRYTISVEVVDQSRRTIVGNGSVLVAREPFKVFVWPGRGHYRTGDDALFQGQARTPDGKPVSGSGKLRLLALSYADSTESGNDTVERQVKETEVAAWDITTDEQGRFEHKVNLPDSGQYRLSAEITDEQERVQEGAYVFFVSGTNEDGGSYRFNDLELIVDQREYQVGDTVNLQVNTNNAGGTVLLFVRPVNGLAPAPKVLKLDGKSTTFPLTVAKADMPNFFVEALTISRGKVYNEVREVFVPPGKRIAHVEVLPGADRYRPSEDATVKVKLTGVDGKPFVGNTVISVYDASLEYIAASSIPEIRKFFWNIRRSHRPGFDSTLTQQTSPVVKNGDIGMQPLYGGRPPGMPMPMASFGMGRGGGGAQYFSRGRNLGMAEGMAMEADMATDSMMAAPSGAMFGAPAPAARMSKSSAVKSEVSDGGNAATVAATTRSNFADTAFWSASVTSDENGIAEVSFKVPDNLTTWKIKAWTLGKGTRVGSGDSEIICSKDLIIRPQTPRFFTETDLMTVSAVVHNYLDSAKSTAVTFVSEGGQLQLLSEAAQTITIPAGGEVRIDWLVKVIASGETKITMKALTDEESDAAEIKVPVKVHGLLKTESWAGVIRPNDTTAATITVNVPAARIEEQSRLEIRYSPTLAGAMVDSLPYLIAYPYGCTEQTLNRFLPAVLTQKTLQRMGVRLEDVQKKRTNLNAQELGDAAIRAAQWKRYKRNPVFDEAELAIIVNTGVTDLTNMQLSDGGWGWFSGYGERSSAHLTAQVVHGLTLAQQNDVPILPDVLAKGVAWLKTHQATELKKLQEGDRRRQLSEAGKTKQLGKRKKPYKMSASNMDAFVAYVLLAHDGSSPDMTDYLYRDRQKLSVYGKSLTGLVLHAAEDTDRRNMVLRNIEQFLEQDDENQTAWLRTQANGWWYWYGSENEAMARYLQLLLKVNPESETASRLVKYLLNNRKHGTYWNSTRDTALVVEAMADYIKATGEDQPDMEVEVVVDGVVQKTVRITGENLFSFDNSLVIAGDAVKTGKHTIQLRRKGKGPLYFNAYLTNFTKEDFISSAGLEVKVSRRFYRLIPDNKDVSVQGDQGQVVRQSTSKFRREPLENLSTVTSGDLIEVEMLIDSKNDYEYLLLEDYKPSGFETDDQRSGYVYEGLRAYRELRDDRISFFLSRLARGKHSISYRIRAEAPSQQVSALPAKIEGMYAPELVGNSDEMKLKVADRN